MRHFSQGFSEDFLRRGYRGDYHLWVVLNGGAEEGFLFEGGAEEGGDGEGHYYDDA